MKILLSYLCSAILASFIVYSLGLFNLPSLSTVFNVQPREIRTVIKYKKLLKIETITAPKGNVYLAFYDKGQVNTYFDKSRILDKISYESREHVPNKDEFKLSILELTTLFLMGLLFFFATRPRQNK